MRQIRMSSVFRRVATAGAAAVVAAPLLVTAAPAQASTTPEVFRFVPIRLEVKDIEDAWPDNADEPRMYYNDAVWAGVVRRGNVPGYMIPSTNFVGHTMAIDLWERDWGWVDSNHLGENTIGAYPLNEERRVEFASDWWDYELVYRVERVS
jgi:hypothetical protein